jgi:RNA polymerase subunit RPABC4/transcription elongation factor Spt4
MNAPLRRCAPCGSLVDVEDLFCANCGTEVPEPARPRVPGLPIEAKNFECRGCGASMNYDAGAQALKCPFCGSVDLAEEPGRSILAPELVIPFAIDRAQAEGSLRAWLGASFWRPDDLRSAAQLTDLRAVFVPFWIFATRVATFWTADTDRTPPGARADWCPITSGHERTYANLWVPAGQAVRLGELAAILPFDPGAAVAPEAVDLAQVTVEQFSVSRRYARPLAQGRLEALEAEAVAAEVPGRCRNVHVNVLMQDATARPALAPLYVMSYRYRGRLYRFVLNGQTGRATGTAPISVAKVAGVLALAVIAVVVVALLVLR